MRQELLKNHQHDSRLNYRGETPSRIDNLTDAAFGIAITLLIFNLSNPNSFEDLLTFTKTLPAFLVSIGYLVLIWKEHVRFSELYALNDAKLLFLNTLFIALVIFYVYPLRFLTLFLTNFFFQANLDVKIFYHQVSDLMIYYGFIAFALYFFVFLFYRRALQMSDLLHLSAFEVFYTRAQQVRQVIMFSIPLLSVLVTWVFDAFSIVWAPFYGGMFYNLYWPALVLYQRWYQKHEVAFPVK